MPIILYRVDERLIHGQVVVGWSSRLKIDQIVLANDQVASNTWERELYLACVPPEIKTTILPVEVAADRILKNGLEGKRGLVLVDSPFDILRMADKGVKIGWLNVGGVHFKTGRTQVLPYLFLSTEEVSAFKRIISLGIRCECRDVPLAEKHDLALLFDKLGW